MKACNPAKMVWVDFTVGVLIAVLIWGIAAASTCAAAEPAKPVFFDNADVRLIITPRTPDQMTAFYLGREFPDYAAQESRNYCIFAFELFNKSTGPLWYDLNQWRFTVAEKPLRRFERQYWLDRWNDLHLPPASQAIFRWSSFLESRDLYPQELIGGLMYFTSADEPIAIIANIHKGEKNSASTIQIPLTIKCAKDLP